MIENFLIVPVIGVAMGFMSSLYGLGGGVLFVPMVISFLNYSRPEAVATSLMIVFLNAGRNTLSYHKRSLIDWKTARIILIFSSIFSFISSKVVPYVPPVILKNIFLFATTIIILSPFFFTEKFSNFLKVHQRSFSIGIGCLMGMLSGFTGVGGGGLITPVLLYSNFVEPIKASPTANAVMMFTSFLAILGSLNFHQMPIHFDDALIAFIASFLGSFLGMKFNSNISLKARKLGLTLVLILIILLTIFSRK